ncbi:hypothetical protein NV391_02395 [Companilactobacillus crustorum]|uniref:hypothetical protein n=1 Tax=Companilactobacillus crustorum TaxID=392416 RepID=UPI00237D3B22|nr:hypothetical protein [Companilactobacillus crustorum]WDT66074.1 hypothetical protein NV391_02395 [Companilactobacillus crustorum]
MCATLSDSIRHTNRIYKALTTSFMNPGIGNLKVAAAALNTPLPTPEMSGFISAASKTINTPFINPDDIGNFKAVAASLNAPLSTPGMNGFTSVASKALKVPYIEELKAIANHTYTDRFKSIANAINTTGFSNPGIQAAAVAATSIPNLKSLTATSNSLSKSIANTFNPNYLKSFTRNYSQIYDNTLTTMRYFSTSNNHINLQWKKLINTELSDDFINSFRDISNATRLSTSLGLSEDDIKQMQDAVNDAYSNDNGSVDYDGAFKAVATTNHLDNKQDESNILSNVNKSSHVFSLYLVITILNIILSTIFFVDGTINDNAKSLAISFAIDKTQMIVDLSKNELKK